MNRLNKALALILIVQIVLAIVIFFPKDEEASSSGPLLTEFDSTSVNELHITDDKGDEITLAKNPDGTWVLPEMDDFPANSGAVSSLLQKITSLQANRLITRSDTSHRRLKVSPDEFMRMIVLKQSDGTEHTLYLGTTGGGNAIHARLDDAENVYLVGGLSLQDAGSQVSAWINTSYVTIPSEQVVSLKLQNANGEFEFVKDGDTWTLVDQSGEEVFNATGFTNMLNQAIGLRMLSPIGKEAKDEYGLDAPQATLTITVNVPLPAPTPEAETESTLEAGTTPTPEATPEPQYEEKVYILQFGAALEEDVVVKSSDSDYFVRVSSSVAQAFIDKAREDFVSQPTPTPTPIFTPTPEITTTPEAATESATEMATEAVTETATEASN